MFRALPPLAAAPSLAGLLLFLHLGGAGVRAVLLHQVPVPVRLPLQALYSPQVESQLTNV